jgi:signal transduction histidine kinase
VVSVVVARSGQFVNVSIEDSGRGFDPGSIITTGTSGLGLHGMRERIALNHRNFEIQSSIGSGTTVVERFPVALKVSG